MAKQSFVTGQVLTAAQLTSLQQTAMSGGAASAKTANYTLVAADAGTAISMTSTSATTITVNTGLFAAGDTVFIQNLGTANLTITAGTATVNTAGSLILPQYDAGILYFVSASSAVFYDYIQTGATSPLTTKGDLYGFGTSDARIPIGTNGQILTADSAETLGLKWATPAGAASGLTLIDTNTFSAVSAVNLNNIFTSTYTNYRVIWLLSSASVVATRIRLRASGTDNTASNYMWGLSGIQYTGQAAYNESINGALETSWKVGFQGGAYQSSWTADILQPQATAVTSYNGICVNPAASSPEVYATSTTGLSSVTTAYDGMSVFPASGTFTGSYWIYGYQKA